MVLLAGVLAVAACNPLLGKQQATYGKDIVIGVPISATGQLAQEGGLTRQGYDLWADWANQHGGIIVDGVHHKVRLVYADDQSQPQVAAQVAQSMVSKDHAQFLLGPYGTPNSAAVAQVANQDRIPLVISNGAAPQIFQQGYRYVFGVVAAADQYVAAIFEWLANENPRPKTIALLTANDAFSLDLAQATVRDAQEYGLKVVYEKQYPAGDTNLFSLVAGAKTTNPDILINDGHLLEAIACAKAAADVRLDAKLFIYALGPDEPEFVEALGKVADDAVTATSWTPQARYTASFGPTSAEYVQAYQTTFNTQLEPSFVTADATAAGLALEAAIEGAQSLQPQRVREALARLDVDTFFGRIKFNPQGQNTYKSILIEQVQDGQRLTVYPPEVAVASPIYPTPTWEARLGLPAQAPNAKLPGTGHPPA